MTNTAERVGALTVIGCTAAIVPVLFLRAPADIPRSRHRLFNHQRGSSGFFDTANQQK
jgi:hypothetical protein